MEHLDEGKVDSVVEPEDGRGRQTQCVQTVDGEEEDDKIKEKKETKEKDEGGEEKRCRWERRRKGVKE